MPEIVDPEDIEMLQDTIVAAVNEALSLVDENKGKFKRPYRRTDVDRRKKWLYTQVLLQE